MIAVILPLAIRGQTLAIYGSREQVRYFSGWDNISQKGHSVLMRVAAQNKILNSSAVNMPLERQRVLKTEVLFLVPTLSLLSEPHFLLCEVGTM